MESSLLTISKIFTERIFRIPDYQRGYAWSEKQLKDYWNDLEQLDIGKNHYVGVLTLESVKEIDYSKWEDDLWIIKSKSYEPFYIVDGQQRLTTTILLIQALLETVKEEEELNFTSLQDIRKKFVYESKDRGISRSYIFGYEKDNPSYEFLKTRIFGEPSVENYICQETIYTCNLEFAKNFFLQKLENYSLNELEDVYTKITQNFLFNIYTISDEIDVFVTFETMNNRGKPLSLLELLKNRLIYLTTRFNEETYEIQSLRKKINECWKTIYHNLGRNKDNPLDDDKFLYNHLMFYFGDEFISTDSPNKIRYINRQYRFRRCAFSNYLLEKEFSVKRIHRSNKNTKNSITIKEINTYVESLQYHVELWFKLNNPNDSDFSVEEILWLNKINRLGFDDFSSLLLVFYRKVNDKVNRIRLLKLIEKLLFFLTNFYRYDINYMPDIYIIQAIDLFKSRINHEKIITDLEIFVKGLYENKENIERLKKEFRRDGFYRWDGIRYFLYEYEESLRQKSKTNNLKLNWDTIANEDEDYISVEHIYPQNGNKENWKNNFSKFSVKQRNILKNSLGNLLPLSRPKNSSLQNKSFSEKLGDENNHIGYIYGSYSENEVALNTDWTAEDILNRGLKLLSFMEKNWEIDLGDENNKIEFLGLEFLKDYK